MFAAALPILAASPAVGADSGVEFFEAKIRPLLVDHCYSCHSKQAEKGVKGGLYLDSKEGVLKGGDTGPALVPGEPERSLLIRAVRYTDENLQMPPKGKKLSAEQIADLEAWVRLGAPDPRSAQGALSDFDTIKRQAKTHWAFQPIQNPSPPFLNNKKLAESRQADPDSPRLF